MSKKRITVDVGADLIALASKASSAHCMIADGIKASMPDARSVSVDLQTIRYSDPKAGKRYIMLTPMKCQEKLLLFDQGQEVQPWSFRLPDPVQIVPMRATGVMDEQPKNRARIPGPKVWKEDTGGIGNRKGIVHGGEEPPINILAHSARGHRRIFGVKASKGFDPSQPDAG